MGFQIREVPEVTSESPYDVRTGCLWSWEMGSGWNDPRIPKDGYLCGFLKNLCALCFTSRNFEWFLQVSSLKLQ